MLFQRFSFAKIIPYFWREIYIIKATKKLLVTKYFHRKSNKSGFMQFAITISSGSVTENQVDIEEMDLV